MQTYIDKISPGVSFPLSNRPSIKANHIDGPLLTFRDGQMHWLTIWERILFALGMTNAERLERKRRPVLIAFVENACPKCGWQMEWYGSMGADAHLCPVCTWGTTTRPIPH